MLIFDQHTIGANLLSIRKKHGLTQSEVAEKAGLADRTYADIERGSVNMRVETLLKICQTYGITPDEILTTKDSSLLLREEVFSRLNSCTEHQQETALNLLMVYLNSLK